MQVIGRLFITSNVDKSIVLAKLTKYDVLQCFTNILPAVLPYTLMQFSVTQIKSLAASVNTPVLFCFVGLLNHICYVLFWCWKCFQVAANLSIVLHWQRSGAAVLQGDCREAEFLLNSPACRRECLLQPPFVSCSSLPTSPPLCVSVPLHRPCILSTFHFT